MKVDKKERHAPHTPPVDNTSQNHLFRVISNIGPKDVDRPSVVTIRTHHDVWF